MHETGICGISFSYAILLLLNLPNPYLFVTKNVENQTWRVRELYFSLFLTFVTISPQIYSTTMAEGYLHYHFLSFISKSLRRNSVSHLRFGMHFELTYQTGEFNEPKLSENVFFMYFLWPFFLHIFIRSEESLETKIYKNVESWSLTWKWEKISQNATKFESLHDSL